MRLYDVHAGDRPQFICTFNSQKERVEFGTLPLSTPAERDGMRTARIALDVPGRTWAVECIPTEQYLARRRTPTSWVALLLGLAVTAVVTAYANALLNQTARVEKLVELRTSELQQVNESLEREIRERRRAEAALRESEHRFRALVENSSDWIWETDAEGIYSYVSPRVTELLGYVVEDVLGKRHTEFLVPDEKRAAQKRFEEAIATHAPMVGIQNTYLHRDGQLVYIETNSVPILDGEAR